MSRWDYCVRSHPPSRSNQSLGNCMLKCFVCDRVINHQANSVRVCSNECNKIATIRKELWVQKKLHWRMGKKKKKKNKAPQRKVKQEKRAEIKRLYSGVSDKFFESRAWKELRYMAIKRHGRACLACGATNKKLHVDHIKPRSKYPHLAWSLNNLQVLCEECNVGKSNKDETDWRKTDA